MTTRSARIANAGSPSASRARSATHALGDAAYRPGGGSIRPLTAAADGAFETDAPATIDLGVKVHGADGSELFAAAGDVTVRSDDTRLTPTHSEGGVATTQAEAGVHHITATGLGLTAPFVIRVTPELPSN